MNSFPDEFERLRAAGDRHFLRKEYVTAVECYKAASEKDDGDNDFFFNFAFSLAAVGRDEMAVTMYRNALRTGSGAPVHNNLGNCLRRLGRLKEAREEHLQATRLDRRNALYWRNLAACQADLKDSAAELLALQSLSRCPNDCTALDWNNLGRAHERDRNFEEALTAFRQAAFHTPDSCYFFNVALIHERLGQILDAFHSCRHSLLLQPGFEHAAKMLPRLEASLKSIHFPSKPNHAKREINTDDYLNPYTLLNLTTAAALPDSKKWFERPSEWETLLGSLTRRRRIVQAGLELDGGTLLWLPQFHLTDEIVHSVLSQLDGSGWHAHHWIIFNMPLLNAFLTFGDLEYFRSTDKAPYPLIADILGVAPDDFDQGEFTAFISPFFRRRWTQAMKGLLRAENYTVARALFLSRAPMTTADLDEAIEPVRNHFTRRIETLRAVESEVKKRKEGKGSVQSHLAAQECMFLNLLAGPSGAKLRDEISLAYRGIALSLANLCEDFAEADLALKAAEGFNVSEAVKEKLSEDRQTLSNILQRQKDERKRIENLKQQEQKRLDERRQVEAKLTKRLVIKKWFREKTLEITPEYYAWDGNRIAAEQITAIRYGITINYVNGIKRGATSILAVGGAGITVSTDWLGESTFQDAVRSVMGLYSTRVLTALLSALDKGVTCQIGDIRLDKRGLIFNTGVFRSTTRTVSWAEASATVATGTVHVAARSDPKAKKSLSLRNDWNACLLPTMIEILKRSTNANGN